MPQVHPTPYISSNGSGKGAGLRGEACLGGADQGASYAGLNGGGSGMEWAQRSEFDLLLDFLDTDGNGKVSALEVADFVDSLLGTQDHKRPNGSIVFEAVLTAALRNASADDPSQPKGSYAGGPVPGGRPPPPPPPPAASLLASKPGSGSGRWTTTSRAEGEDGSVAGAAGKQQQQQLQLVQQQTSRSQQQVASGGLAAVLGGPSSVSNKEVHEYGSSRFLSMDDVRRCFADLLEDTDLWMRLTSTCSVMTTTLFRQLLMYSADRLEKKFRMTVFLKTWAAFNTLPLWLPFPMLWRKHGTLFLVYLHQLTKLRYQLGPGISRRLPMHETLVVLTMLQFIATYVPLIAFIAAHAISAIANSKSIVDFMHANPMHDQISLFSSILPLAVLQFLTSSAALKLSCRDFINLKEQCKAVFMLGDVSSEFEGYPGLTVREVMDSIKSRVDLTIATSSYRKMNDVVPLLFGISLEAFRRLVRLFLVGNIVAHEPLGKVIAPFEVYALVYNIWFAYSESADCTYYLYKLRKISSVFKTLLSKEEALSQSLPWLNNHSPRNLLLWSRLRRYYQSPNCLELRWIEMHLTLVVAAAIAVTVILIITFVQKTLLRFSPENADLQLFVVWVIPAFIYLLLALVIDVIMSASTGMEYHDGVMTLSAEAVFISDRLNSAEEIARRYGDTGDDDEEQDKVEDLAGKADGAADSDDEDEDEHQQRQQQPRGPAAGAGGGGGLSTASRRPASSPPSAARRPPSETGLVRRVPTGSSGVGDDGAEAPGAAAGGGGGGGGGAAAAKAAGRARSGSQLMGPGGSGGGGSGWVPALHYQLSRRERTRLKQCQAVIKSLVTYIQFNAEFITIFGVPIDTHLRNTLFSVSVTLVGAGISAFLAVVIRR